MRLCITHFIIIHVYWYVTLICHILCTHLVELVEYDIIYTVTILWSETFCLVSIWTLWTEALWLGFRVLS